MDESLRSSPDLRVRIFTKDHYEKGTPIHLPDWISSDHVRRYRYSQEPYFQEAWEALRSLGQPERILHSVTYLLLKPDAFPPRCMGLLANALSDLHFEVIGFRSFRFCRYSIRELWRYEYNLADVQRYWLLDEFLPAGDSLLLLLGDLTGCADASARLSDLKGPTSVARRSQNSLRSRIGARAGTLNHIHCPDSMIDLVREIGVLFPADSQRAIFSALASRVPSRWAAVAEELSVSYPEHSLSMAEVLRVHGEKLRSAIDASEGELRSHTRRAMGELQAAFRLSLWDVVTVANEYLRFNVPGVPRALDFESAT